VVTLKLRTGLLGEPGSGKTTMTSWLAVAHAHALADEEATVRVPLAQVDVMGTANGEQLELGRPLLPVVVQLADYAAKRRQGQLAGNLLEFLGYHSANLGRPVWQRDVGGFGKGEAIPDDKIARLIREAIRSGRALIILDGLDEVPTEERDQISAEIDRFITWHGPRAGPPLDDGNRVLITSRSAGYQFAPLPTDLAQVTIEPMSLDDVRVLSQRWLRAMFDLTASLRDLPSAADELSADFFGMLSLDHNAGVREVTSSPLFASMLLTSFLNDVGDDLPAQRVEVYESLLETLNRRWEKRRPGSETAQYRMTVVKALPAVAAHFFAAVPSGVFGRDKLSEELVAEVARLERGHPESPTIIAQVESLIDIMWTDVGLLKETEPNVFSFSHRTIQEFLTARHLVSGPRYGAQEILAHLVDPRWRDVILLAIGLINYKHRDKLTTVADELLAAKGPLAELFPEPALVLAAAIPQMLDVPGQVVVRVTNSLLSSYASLCAKRRLRRLQELIESAVAGLRSSEHLSMIDRVLVDALTDPGHEEPSAACATAQLILGVGDPTTALAQALVTAARRWDQPEFSKTLLRLVSKDPASSYKLAGNWDSRLRMRTLLRRNPGLVERIRQSGQWLSIMLCLYGGMPDLGAAETAEDFQRMTACLELPHYVLNGFKPFMSKLLNTDDSRYATAIYSETVGYDLRMQLAQPLVFTPDAIIRNSPFTDRIITALENDNLPDLTGFFRSRLPADDTERAEALVALWSLGAAPPGSLTEETTAAAMARRRIAAVAASLRDATVRALSQSAGDTLLAARRTLGADDWNRLYDAIITTAIRAGAPQMSMLSMIGSLSPDNEAHLLTEELTQRISGSGEDSIREAARIADKLNASRQPPVAIISALNARGRTTYQDLRHCTRWWPADPLAFPYQDRDDVPIGVLDQAARMPGKVFFGIVWMLRDVVMPVVNCIRWLKPEVLAIAWTSLGRGDADATEFIAELDPAILDSDNPVAYLHGVAGQVHDPWHRARALLRIAELFAHGRAEALRGAARAGGTIGDPVLAFQVRERLALLSPTAERAEHLSVARRLAAEITDPAIRNIALLRLARFERPAVITGEPTLITDELESAGDAIARNLASAAPLQAWIPVALFTLATDLSRTADHAARRNAWRHLASAPSPATVASVLASEDGPFISCTETAAVSIMAAFDHAERPAELYSLLPRLAHLECGAEPAVREWLEHSDTRLREIAALLLAEYGGWRAELAEPVARAQLAEDDLLRARANACLWTGGSFGATSTVSSLGRTGVETLVKFRLEHPRMATHSKWAFANLLHDDAGVFAQWCAEFEGDPSARSAAGYVLRNICLATKPVWELILDRLQYGCPDLQTALLKSVTWMRVRISPVADHQPAPTDVSRLVIDLARWQELWHVLGQLNPASLTEPRLIAHEPDVVRAAGQSLAATSGVFDADMIGDASARLYRETATSFGQLVSGDEDVVRRALTEARRAWYVVTGDTHATAVEMMREHLANETESRWPWATLLVGWFKELLTMDTDQVFYELYPVGRTLNILAGLAAEKVQECARADHEFPALLAEAVSDDGSWSIRRDAAQLLGVLRHASSLILGTLLDAICDEHEVRDQALWALQRLEGVDQDEDLLGQLYAALYSPSGSVAWAAGQVLMTLGQSTDQFAVRQRIVAALAGAIADPRSQRPVHLCFAGLEVPGTPQLDDVLAEGLSAIYRFGGTGLTRPPEMNIGQSDAALPLALVHRDSDGPWEAKVSKDQAGEFLYLVRGKDGGRPAWHYVEIAPRQLTRFKRLIRTGSLDVSEHGSILHSGWGGDPPDELADSLGATFWSW
jgi:hypothetical protein